MAPKKQQAAEAVKNEEAVMPADADLNRKVTVHLFKDNSQYKDAMYVSVNDQNYMIPRGVDVEVPWYVAEVIYRSVDGDQQNADMMRKLEEDYNK